uniref:Uncharacterized protein n=1 Tax=Anolis carolinensis TaxID=28377 RepID=A0A803U0E2_ANOCA
MREFTLEKNHINAKIVAKIFLRMRGSIQERNHTSVKGVGNPLKFTQERNHIDARSVENVLLRMHTLPAIGDFTQERNHTNARSVGKAFLGMKNLSSTRDCTQKRNQTLWAIQSNLLPRSIQSTHTHTHPNRWPSSLCLKASKEGASTTLKDREFHC